LKFNIYIFLSNIKMSKQSKKKKFTRSKNKYKRKKNNRTFRKKRLKYKRITKLGRKWMKQMELFMLSVQG
jgi:hypothetical protein